MNKKVQTIKLAPFSEKYINYFQRSKIARINCLEGAIRSGKTILNICAFSDYLDNHKTGGLFIASGITSGVAWEVLAENRGHSSLDGKYGAPEGFGLLYMFRGRCKKTKIKNVDALEIKNKYNKICDILFVGAKNKGCIEAIRGLTISGWIATELENHSTEEGNDFIGFMFGRLLGAPNGKMFFDLNPSYPSNKMYTKYLDTFEETLGKAYNYLKCGIFDNSAFTKEQINETLKLYKDKSSVMYQRDILGNRACAEGLIFGMFAKDSNLWILNSLDELRTKQNKFISIGVDFGGNGSNTAFCATLIYENYHGVCPIADLEINMSSNESDIKSFRTYLKDFIAFIDMLGVAKILYIYGDNADPVMLNEIRSVLREIGRANIRTIGSVKRTIKERIIIKKKLMSYNHWSVYKNCSYVISSTQTQVWDSREEHEDERLDNGSVDIDIADAEEYSWSAFADKLIKFCN